MSRKGLADASPLRCDVQPSEHRQQPEEQPQSESQFPDGGWGWVVAAGVFLIALVVPMLLPSFGILFSRQLLEWRASSTVVALIFNTFLVVWRLAGVVIGTLTREFGFRRVAVTGTLLTASCLTLSAFATSPLHLLFTFSLGCGLGNGLSCVGYLILAHYFRRHRGVANSLLVAGAGLGHFVSPLVIRLLQEEYGVRGATIILGGITLHAVVGAALFQPVEWHYKKPQQTGDAEDPETASSLLGVNKASKEGGKAVAPVETFDIQTVDDSESASHTTVRHKNCIVYPGVTLFKSDYLIRFGATWRVRLKGWVRGVCTRVGHVVRCVARDIQILRQPTCLIIAVASTLVVNTEANFLVMVPFAIQAAGYSLQTAAWCISIAGVSNLLTRMSVSALSDQTWFKMRHCYMAGMAVMVLSVLVFTLQLGVVWQGWVMGVWGCAAGMFYGLNNLLMTRVVGLDRLISVYGARNLLGALGFFTVGPLLGVIRDASGSYAVSMWVLAAIMSLSFLLWLLMPAAQAYERRMAVVEARCS